MPEHLRYRYCPLCKGDLTGSLDEEGIARARCSLCGWTHYPCNVQLVNLVITTSEGLVFLFPADAPPDAPAALPGGVVEYGETPEQAAIREAREETGLEVDVARCLARVFYPDFPFGPSLAFMFEARMIGGTLRDGLEGRVGIFKEGEFPAIAARRKGSRRALATYLAITSQEAVPHPFTVIDSWLE